jgi:hypothetical protein
MRPVPVSRFAPVALLAFVAGCASTYYRDPTLDENAAAPSARLVIRNQNAELSALRTFEDAATCRKPLQIPDASLIAAGEEADIGVRAGHDFTFEARRVGPDACSAIATFKPEAGKRYLAQFGSSGPVCWLNVVRVDSVVPPKVAPEPSLRARRASPAGGKAGCAAE